MNKTFTVLAIGFVGLTVFGMKPAQAQADGVAPISASAPEILIESAKVNASPTASVDAVVQDGKAVAQRDKTELAAEVGKNSVRKSTFVRTPMTSRLFPSMMQ